MAEKMTDEQIDKIAQALAAKLAEPGGAKLLGCGSVSSSQRYDCPSTGYRCSGGGGYECGGAGTFNCNEFVCESPRFRCADYFNCGNHFFCWGEYFSH